MMMMMMMMRRAVLTLTQAIYRWNCRRLHRRRLSHLRLIFGVSRGSSGGLIVGVIFKLTIGDCFCFRRPAESGASDGIEIKN